MNRLVEQNRQNDANEQYRFPISDDSGDEKGHRPDESSKKYVLFRKKKTLGQKKTSNQSKTPQQL